MAPETMGHMTMRLFTAAKSGAEDIFCRSESQLGESEGLDVEELGCIRRGYQGDILAQRACGLAEESGGCAVPTLGPLICFLIHPTLDGCLKEDPSVCRLVHTWWKPAQGILACHRQPHREREGKYQE